MLAEAYLKTVTERIGSLDSSIGGIRKAAEKIVRSVFEGAHIFVFDPDGIIDSELSNRASGLALFRRYFPGRTKTKSGDVIIVFSYMTDNETAMGVITSERASGATAIVIAPPGSLIDTADIAIANSTDTANGVLDLSGVDKAFCPISGITNAMMGWALTAECMAIFIAENKKPSVWWGEHLKGGAAKRIEIRRQFAAQGY